MKVGGGFGNMCQKNFITFEDCIIFYNEAPNGYHILTNNSADFARYIWNQLH